MVCDWYNCYFSFWALHFSFTPLTAQKWKFQKNEKTNKLGDTFILHKRAKNHDHMLYCSLDLACDGCNCYFFGGGSYYLPFYPPNSPKNENFKQMKKKTLEISSFYTSVPRSMIIFFTVLKIWHVTDVIIFHFGLFFALLPP